MLHHLISALCFLLVGAVGLLEAQELPQKPPGLSDALWEQLVAVDLKTAEIRDLSAAFRQHKFTPILKKPLVSEGRLWVRGDRMLWETRQPRPGVMFLVKGDLHLLYPQEKRMEIYPLKDAMAAALAGPMPRLAHLLEGFFIEPAGAMETGVLIAEPQPLEIGPQHLLVLTLRPRQEKLAERVARVDVLVDLRSGVLHRMSRTDARGHRTVVTLSDIRLNSDFDSGLLEPVIPPGTSVSRPLEALTP